jgi:hypothetical protein
MSHRMVERAEGQKSARMGHLQLSMDSTGKPSAQRHLHRPGHGVVSRPGPERAQKHILAVNRQHLHCETRRLDSSFRR